MCISFFLQIYICIHIYICIYICVCVCVLNTYILELMINDQISTVKSPCFMNSDGALPVFQGPLRPTAASRATLTESMGWARGAQQMLVMLTMAPKLSYNALMHIHMIAT